jgi:hypothetical protein
MAQQVVYCKRKRGNSVYYGPFADVRFATAFAYALERTDLSVSEWIIIPLVEPPEEARGGET